MLRLLPNNPLCTLDIPIQNTDYNPSLFSKIIDSLGHEMGCHFWVVLGPGFLSPQFVADWLLSTTAHADGRSERGWLPVTTGTAYQGLDDKLSVPVAC